MPFYSGLSRWLHRCILRIILVHVLVFSFPGPLCSSAPDPEQLLLQVEYALMEMDTQRAAFLLHWLLQKRPDDETEIRSRLRLYTLQADSTAIWKENGQEEEKQRGYPFLRHLIEASHLLDQEGAAGFAAALTSLTRRAVQKPGNETTKADLPALLQLLKHLYLEHTAVNDQNDAFLSLLEECDQFARQAFGEDGISSVAWQNEPVVKQLLQCLLHEWIRQLFLALCKPLLREYSFYSAFGNYLNLLTLNKLKMEWYHHRLSCRPGPDDRLRLEEQFDINYVLLDRLHRQGLINNYRKKILCSAFDSREMAILHYRQQYDISRDDYWLHKIFRFMEANKAGLFLARRPLYTSFSLVKDLGKRVFYEIEHSEAALSLQLANQDSLQVIRSVVKLARQYQWLFRIQQLSFDPADEVPPPKLDKMVEFSQVRRSPLLMFTESRHYYFAIYLPGAQVRFRLIPKQSSLKSAVRDIRGALTEADRVFQISRADLDAFDTGAHILYQSMLQPLFGNDIPGHLTIIPDGDLSYIPFETLVIGKDAEAGGRSSYLVEATAITYSLSCKLLVEGSSDPKLDDPQDVLIVAPDKSLAAAASGPARLTGAFREAGAIAVKQPFGSSGNWITSKKQFLQMDLTAQRLHFAWHGQVGVPGKEPALVFPDEQTTYFYRSEVGLLKTVPAAVILSSCNSGIGENLPEEGLQSIGQKFLQRGARQVVVSLCKLEDQATARLIQDLYSLLLERHPVAVALQKAKVQFLQTADAYHRYPLFWGGLTVYGT